MAKSEELVVISADETNRILGAGSRSCDNSRVEFSGKNNILFLENGVDLKNANIRFQGDNALLFLSKGRHRFNADITLETDASCVFGHNVFMNRTKPLQVCVREGTSLVIGNDCLFSLAIKIDTKTENSAKNILIDPHVWLCQNATILGGSRILSGAIIGSDTQINGQKIPSGSCWGCRNGKLVKLYKKIVFIKKTIRNTARENVKDNDVISENELQEILKITKDHWKWVLKMLESVKSSEERLALLRKSADKRQYERPDYKEPAKAGTQRDDTELLDNRIIGSYTSKRSRIKFRGRGNVLIIEDGVILKGTRLNFKGDNSLVYLSKSDHPYSFRASIHTDTNLYMGEKNRFAMDDSLCLSISEAQSVLVGDLCEFGNNIWLRTSDQHPIYDQKTRKRVNPPKSVLIGDGVVIPDDALILKGRWIGVRKEAVSENRYGRILNELQETTDMTERIDLMLKLRTEAE